MKRFFLISLTTLVFNLAFACSSAAQGLQWLKKIKNIIPLQSTHQDIVKIFGEPEKSDYPYFRVFRLSDGKLTVRYSTGGCDEKKKAIWNVPALTATSFSFVPKRQPKPEQLGMDFMRFVKSEIFDVPNAFIFSDDESGISFVKTSKGKIESITFDASTKFDYLRCPE